jgi:hypothetical protein
VAKGSKHVAELAMQCMHSEWEREHDSESFASSWEAFDGGMSNQRQSVLQRWMKLTPLPLLLLFVISIETSQTKIKAKLEYSDYFTNHFHCLIVVHLGEILFTHGT